MIYIKYIFFLETTNHRGATTGNYRTWRGVIKKAKNLIENNGGHGKVEIWSADDRRFYNPEEKPIHVYSIA